METNGLPTPVAQPDPLGVAQALSGRIVLDPFVQTLMTMTLEQAGAGRGLLILFRNDQPWIEAEATAGGGNVEVHLRREPVTPTDLPESMLRQVIQTQETVLLDGDSPPDLFSEDEYLRGRRPASVLCLPVSKQALLRGVLYLENRLVPNAFTAARRDVLNVLASQAAISLDHARLYAELVQENNERKKAEDALSRVNRTLQTLYDCNDALVHATTEPELLQSVCDTLVGVGGLRMAWIGRCEHDAHKTVRPVAKAGFGLAYLDRSKISWGETERGLGPSGIAFRTGKPYWVKDIRSDPVFGPWRADALAQGYASCVALPLMAEGQPRGTLNLYAPELNAFNEGTLKQYTELADNLVFGMTALQTREARGRAEVALKAALAEQEKQTDLARAQARLAKYHADELHKANALLKHSLNALARDQTLSTFVEHVLLVLTEQLGGLASTLWLLQEGNREMVLHSLCQNGQVIPGRDSDHPNANRPHPFGEGDPTWLAIQAQRPFVQYDPANDRRFYTAVHRAQFEQSGVQAMVWIPLVFGDHPVGVLGVRMRDKRAFDSEELELAHALAQQATLALELTRLAEQAERTAVAVERQRAAEGRLAELTKANRALRSCLDAVASDEDLDGFLGRVMAAVTDQMGGDCSKLWLHDFEHRIETLELVYQDGKARPPAEIEGYPQEHWTVPLDYPLLDELTLQPLVGDLTKPSRTLTREAHRFYFLKRGCQTMLTLGLFSEAKPVGRLAICFACQREFRAEELEIAKAISTQASLAIRLTRLAQKARQSGILEERNRMAAEIHDSLTQIFTAISMQLFAAHEVIQAKGESGLTYLERAAELAEFGVAEARRSALSLQSAVIGDAGLIEALQRLVDRSLIPGRVQCEFHAQGVAEASVPPPVRQDLLRIAQEAISNAVRHAKPTVIRVALRGEPPNLVLEVNDNGHGISDPELASAAGLGFSNMQARAKHLGAQLDVRTSTGRGTTLTVRLPLTV